MRFTDPDGMWPDWGDVISTANDVIGDAVNAFASDVSGTNAPTSRHRSATSYNNGRISGHVAALIVGALEFDGGSTGAIGGVVAAPETGGLSLAVSGASVGIATHGLVTIKNAVVNMVSGNDKGESPGPYKRPNNAITKEQRESVQGKPCVTCGEAEGKRVADHKTPLVKEHYETGKIDKEKMKQKDAVQPQCTTCSAKQGAEMSRYSKEQKKANGYQ